MRHLLPLALCLVLTACSAPLDAPAPPSPPPSTTPSTPGVLASPTLTPLSPTPSATPSPTPTTPPSPTPTGHTFSITQHERLDQPWAMAALPGTTILAITEKGGRILLRSAAGLREVSGAPAVTVTGQGGMGDLIAGPTFTEDGVVFLSWVESGQGGTGAVVGRAKLDVEAATLSGLERLWVQTPKVDNGGHYSHRLAVSDGYLFVSSGDRRQFSPAQDLGSSLGKILRLTLDGKPAPGNPFDGAASEIWSLGHRNPLGLAFNEAGQLFSSEMGPKGGDELNLIRAGRNYGWPLASNGSNYDGSDIPDHAPGDGFEAPLLSWNPSISPGSLLIYHGEAFPAWRGDAFIGALSGEALIRVNLDGDTAEVAETWPMGARIREVEEGQDGAIWLLRDDGDLLELRPA